MNKCCSNCVFYYENGEQGNDNDVIGNCRRFPPSYVGPTRYNGHEEIYDGAWLQPYVSPEITTCGEHRRNAKSIRRAREEKGITASYRRYADRLNTLRSVGDSEPRFMSDDEFMRWKHMCAPFRV